MNIAAAWPYVLAIAPVVVGSAAFAKTLLEIRKLQIEIRKLEGDDSKQRLLKTEQKVAQSTGRVRRFVFVFLIVSLAAAISISAFLRGQSIGIAKEAAKEEADAKRVEVEKSRLFEKSRQADEKRQQQLNELLARVTELTAKASNPEAKKDAEALKTEIKDVVSLVKVVSIHVGGDDYKEGKFTYTAPAGYIIKSFRMIERAKGGDAQYHPQLVSSTQLEVSWSVKSRTVRGPFKMVVDTKTAFLDLDVEITLQQAAKAPNQTMEPTASRRTFRLYMSSSRQSAAMRALASGG